MKYAIPFVVLGSNILPFVSANGDVVDNYRSEIVIHEDTVHDNYVSPLPHEYLLDDDDDLPDAFNWGNVDGKSYLTTSINQHIPQYCGSCWAFGSISALADRLKIARGGTAGEDINLSIQFILNCGGRKVGSCHGGYHTAVYQFIQETGYIPYESCQPYIACSAESTEGFCEHVDTTCTPANVCKTCDTFGGMGGACTEIDIFPNATVAEFGQIDYDENVVQNIMTEIYVRGPVAATINAEPIVDWLGGVFKDSDAARSTNHIVSIVGWGTEKDTGDMYWIIRNSWGQYWSEMGFIKVLAGQNVLGIEGAVAWATPGQFTIHNYPCNEDGSNCDFSDGDDSPAVSTHYYQDPSKDIEAVLNRRLSKTSNNNNKPMRNKNSMRG